MKDTNRQDAKAAEQRVWQLLEQGKKSEALKACSKLNKQFPRYTAGWYTASQLAARFGNWQMSLDAIDRALSLEPDQSSCRLQRANCLARLGRTAQAAAIADELANDPLLASAYQQSTLGFILSRAGRQEEALPYYERAQSLEPDRPDHLYNLATVYRFIGKLQAAERSLSDAIELNPLDGEAWRLRSDLKRWSTGENHVSALEQALQSPGLSPRASTQLNFALAKELEDLEQWQASFTRTRSGAEQRRQLMRYDVQDDLDTMELIARTYSAELISSHTGGYDTQEPIFVLGLPRTGTTLVERVLGSHSQVTPAGELDNFAIAMSQLVQAAAGSGQSLSKQERVALSAKLDFSHLGEAYLESTRPLTGGLPHFVDKLPLNFLYCGLIHMALPKARIVHLRRHPMDACYAIYKTLFADAYPYSYSLEELGRYYLAYRNLMAHWDSVMPGVIEHVDYESLTSDPEQQIRKLLDYCGLPFEEDCLNFHRSRAASTTASASQIREPMHTRSVGKWRNFETELEPLLDQFRKAGLDLAVE